MESELSNVFQLKLFAENILFGTPQTHSIQIIAKRIVRDTKYFSKIL